MKNLMLDIPVTLSVEVGKKKFSIKEFLLLQQGTLITLDTKVQEPIKFYINGKLYGLCEIVAIAQNDNLNKEKYGIKIIKIFTPQELLKIY